MADHDKQRNHAIASYIYIYIYTHTLCGTYQLLGEVNSGIMIAHLLALAAATEHANPPEPTGLHHHFPGRRTMAVLVCGLSSLRTTTPVPYLRL